MESIKKLIEKLSEVSQIPFRVSDELGDIYVSPSFNSKDLFVREKVVVNDKEINVFINKDYEKFKALLLYYIENTIKDFYYKKEIVIKKLLENKEVSKEEIVGINKILLKRFNMIIISYDGDIKEAYEIVNESYNKENIIITNFNNKIILLGKLDDVYEHVLSIKETIESNISGKILLSYCSVKDYTNLYDCFVKCNKKMDIVKRFHLDIEIIKENEVIFEEIIESINKEKKEELINEYSKGFKKLDLDMMKTIDVFFNCGLNLSEAAKELYIHRNTLIYRLEKIQKYTGFDIKNFNEAVIFKSIYTVWKEENKIF